MSLGEQKETKSISEINSSARSGVVWAALKLPFSIALIAATVGWSVIKLLFGAMGFLMGGDQSAASESSSGRVKKRFGTHKDEAKWDGLYLTCEFDGTEWEYDGTNLKRRWGEEAIEWKFDGRTLSPRWHEHVTQYEFDNNRLRPKYGDKGFEYEISDGTVRRLYDSSSEIWDIEGSLPIPVLAKAIGAI